MDKEFDAPEFAEFSFLWQSTYSCNGQEHTVAEYTHKETGMEFSLIPGGTYWVRGGDNPSAEVELDSFMVGRYPVTQKEWRQVMEGVTEDFAQSNRPMEKISWIDAGEFCLKTGLRLLWEAEWEVACRGGTKSKFYWGNEMDPEHCWYFVNSGMTPQPVGQKKPNAFGLHDMLGNVWEWCRDTYQEEYPSSKKNPRGASGGKYRVYRGGASYGGEEHCAVSHRQKDKPEHESKSFGFRCAWTPE